LDFGAVHEHVERLQRLFFDALSANSIPALPLNRLVPPVGAPRGNFLTFALPQATEVEATLTAAHVSVDRRRDRLRFGFGVYHDENFVDRLVDRTRKALAGIEP
jgi:selenocysteine lyase/cysteine desulfurase